MSLGLGIFLSSLFLGIIFLFVSTKDRWNWKKILLIWPLYFVLVVGVIGGGGFYIYNHYENKPITYDTYWDIPINSNITDILFLKGKASSISHAENYEQKEMTYMENDDTYYDIRINDNNLIGISCRINKYSFFSNGFTPLKCASINDININSRVDEIKALLGDPSSEFVSDDKLKRVWVYEKYRTYFVLKKSAVITLGIYNPPFNIDLSNNIYKYKVIELWDGDLIKYAPIFTNEEQLKNAKEAIKIAKEQNPQTSEFTWDELIEIRNKVKAEELAQVERLRELQEKAKAKEESKADELKKLATKKKVIRQATPEEIDSVIRIEDDPWQKLKKGMATYQVEKLLGKPVRKEGSYWYYSENRREGAYIFFLYSRRAGVEEIWDFKAP